VTRAERATIPVGLMRDLVLRAALLPGRGQWQLMVIEDADRLTSEAANALLKAIEEPTPRTVWLLCAPSVEDVLPTIRSRCRSMVLTTPSVEEITRFLTEHVGAPAEVASYAARASQGHIGRARALALDEAARRRRGEVVRLPPRLVDIGSCMNAADQLMGIAKEETEALTGEVNTAELHDLQHVFGSDSAATSSRSYKAALKRLEEDQTQRAKRRVMDVIDRCLMDLLSVYRDAIALASAPDAELINEEMRQDLVGFIRRSTREENVRRIGSVFEARQRMLEHNAAPLLALESMMVSLRTR
jgi:DNA polymerase-3 subunit delta'